MLRNLLIIAVVSRATRKSAQLSTVSARAWSLSRLPTARPIPKLPPATALILWSTRLTSFYNPRRAKSILAATICRSILGELLALRLFPIFPPREPPLLSPIQDYQPADVAFCLWPFCRRQNWPPRVPCPPSCCFANLLSQRLIVPLAHSWDAKADAIFY